MMEDKFSAFAKKVSSGDVEIYNEFSLQHELGLHLRQSLTSMKVQFERNVSYFGMTKSNFIKREIDVSIFDREKSLLAAAVELKYPRNGQYPEQMFSFCKDISFAEQLIRSGFREAYVVIFAEDHLFYEGSQNGIYGFFRGGSELTGLVKKPTGKCDTELYIEGNYLIDWQPVKDSLKYTIIKAQ